MNQVNVVHQFHTNTNNNTTNNNNINNNNNNNNDNDIKFLGALLVQKKEK